MASENVEDWDKPISVHEDVEPEEEISAEERKKKKNLEKLKKYVNKMAYKPVMPPPTKKKTKLAEPKKIILKDNYSEFKDVLSPRQRAQRLKQTVAQFTAISTEQLEEIIKQQRNKEKKKEAMIKRKQELYYEMLSKLERQCRTQYLNVLIKKFANFIAKLATTMRIPPQLVEPYARMQRGIFCNILLAIGVQPTNQSSIYYSSQEALEYEVCHKLAHALLSLIIKALDSAAIKQPDDDKGSETEFEMDNYIKERLMCAAAKKISNERYVQPKGTAETTNSMLSPVKKCDYFNYNYY